ncbi:L-amino acid N-acyltransferase YncA [Streptomyces sp. Amel2xB2]|uniref:GNAT family N-acetyltransferase n=1 Tax=Streptomyces sp. Amel2xB2 TaxID=1305829 RepID=UPI000DBA666F|nr:GNAT family N-acetyltransferase [Streptomyces sp. Amel2xB2]RAJ69920.1 L-amino acid N-acyltransferase YncA [Streptomyces sp. Amel2xB2]
MLTLAAVAENPLALTRHLELADGPDVVFRPLTHADAERLAAFFEGQSTASRRLSTFGGYDLAFARELCDAIARHDKLRLVLEEVPSGRIVGLLEISLGLHPSDIARYREADVYLGATDCRFGPTLADDYQGKGVGTQVFPLVVDVARRFGKKRMILWGGVLADNPRAIRYYEKHGFQTVGSFTDADGARALDMILDLRPPQGR